MTVALAAWGFVYMLSCHLHNHTVRMAWLFPFYKSGTEAQTLNDLPQGLWPVSDWAGIESQGCLSQKTTLLTMSLPPSPWVRSSPSYHNPQRTKGLFAQRTLQRQAKSWGTGNRCVQSESSVQDRPGLGATGTRRDRVTKSVYPQRHGHSEQGLACEIQKGTLMGWVPPPCHCLPTTTCACRGQGTRYFIYFAQ